MSHYCTLVHATIYHTLIHAAIYHTLIHWWQEITCYVQPAAVCWICPETGSERSSSETRLKGGDTQVVETTYRIKGAPRLALLADLHGRDPAPVLSSLTTHRPSLICLAGDIVYGSQPEDNISPLETQSNVLPFLSSCASIAPTYLSLGNHEWMLDEQDLAVISSTGVVILDNEWRATQVDGKEIVIGGLTSGYVTDYRKATQALRSAANRYPKKESIEGLKGLRTASERLPEVAWLEEYSSTPGYHILLSHHPEYYPLIPSPIDLILSGHTHNGQIAYYSFRRHRWQGLWAPGQGWLPRYSKGVYDERLVVSAGLSNTARIPRLFNSTEVVFVEPE